MQTVPVHHVESSAPRPPAEEGDRRATSRAGRAVLVAAVALALLLVVAELILPSLAASRIKHRLEQQGTVTSVKVGAFPAVKLLWGHADEVDVRMQQLRAATGDTGGGIGQALDRIGAVRRLDLSVGTLEAGPLILHDARVTKRGADLSATATLLDPDVRRALPTGLDVRPVADPDGSLRLEGTMSVLGIRARASARLLAQEGRLVIEPELGGLADAAAIGPFADAVRITVFAQDRVELTSVGGRYAAGGLVLTAAGRLVG